MGQLETSGRKRKRKRDLKYAILTAVKLSALAGVSLMAPNLPQALYKMGILSREANDTTTLQRARRQLIRRGLLAQRNGKLVLTSKGAATAHILQSQYSIQKPKRWDGRWRVLIFDIPEYRKGVRDKIRRTLVHIGFVRLQDSVWAYPYDCEDLIILLKADFKIGKDMLYMIVDELEGDRNLRKEFRLAQ
jgi:DNA-binding transcriptional regulator PaaX